MLCNLKHVHSAKVEGNMGLGVIRAADGGKTVSANFDRPSAMAWLIGGSSSVSLGMIPPIGQRILEIQIAPAKVRIVVLEGATGTLLVSYWWSYAASNRGPLACHADEGELNTFIPKRRWARE